MELKCGSCVLDFRLKPGIYTDWSGDSATGKTYTTKLLNALIASGHNDILVLTYDTVNAAGIDNYVNKIKNGNYSLIFVDRADLYMNDYLYEVLENSGAIVYIDIKKNSLQYSYCGNECYIDFNLERIIYYVDNF